MYCISEVCHSISSFANLFMHMQLWNGFLGVSHTDQVLPCIQQEWQKQLQHIIKERVHHEQVNVYCLLTTRTYLLIDYECNTHRWKYLPKFSWLWKFVILKSISL